MQHSFCRAVFVVCLGVLFVSHNTLCDQNNLIPQAESSGETLVQEVTDHGVDKESGDSEVQTKKTPNSHSEIGKLTVIANDLDKQEFVKIEEDIKQISQKDIPILLEKITIHSKEVQDKFEQIDRATDEMLYKYYQETIITDTKTSITTNA